MQASARVHACNDIRRVFTTLWRHKLEILHIHFKLIRGGRSRERLEKKKSVGLETTKQERKIAPLNLSGVKIYVMTVCCGRQKKKLEQQFIPNWQNHSDFAPNLVSDYFSSSFVLPSFLPFFVSGAWLDLEGTIKLLFPRGALLSI